MVTVRTKIAAAFVVGMLLGAGVSMVVGRLNALNSPGTIGGTEPMKGNVGNPEPDVLKGGIRGGVTGGGFGGGVSR